MRAERLIVIGASAGGITALQTIIRTLPSEVDFPLVAVLHMHPLSRPDYTLLFPQRKGLCVCEAEEKQEPLAGHLYLAPPNYHLLLELDGSFSLSADEPVNWARPSIDVLFESAAEAFGSKVIGVILTGANSDGARDYRQSRRLEGTIIIEDPRSAEVSMMPQAALSLTSPDRVLSLEAIGPFLGTLCQAIRESLREGVLT